MVHPTPTPEGNTLAIRGDPDLPKELQPVLKDDHLPDGDPKDAIQDTDFDITLDELKDCEDFDPDGGDSGSKSRLRKRKSRSGTVRALRNVYYKGKRYKEAFIASPDKRFIFLKSKGARSKKNPVGTYETSKEIPKNSKKEWYLQWQPDHVCDLGIFTQLGRLDTPKGIKEAAWTTAQDGIFGETPSNGGNPSANDNTKILGQLLNSPQNIRGMSAEMNAAKSKLMRWVYSSSTDTPDFYKKVHRSTAWGVYRHLVRTKDQFDDTMKKASTVIKDFIKDDDESAKAIEKYFNEEGSKFPKKAIDQLATAFKDPPPEDSKKSIFKVDDCSNTADSPDDPDAKTNNAPNPTPVAATPTPVAPTPTPVTDSCDVSYKVAFDTYEIRGKNFDEAKLGKDGSGLKKQLGGCALITFHFEQTPNDPRFTWYASGRTGATQKKCIGHALESAGGVDVGNCHGAG